MQNFCAKVLLLERQGEKDWKETEKVIHSVNELRSFFKPYEDEVVQVNIDMFKKVYYGINFSKDGIHARMTDMDEESHYMCSPILLVECDSTKPVNISEETKNSIKDAIDFY